MISYQVFLNNIFQSTIQADSRQQAVALAHAEYAADKDNVAGIHISKIENWRTL